ncbi:hypothetical protein L1987_65239 [Smallanthus sonchifolius]|uniref:Uncharacterized protein n=1 Tax=Smallanthus sonchifolius TaxID=185202 RepID=A0ACB9BTT3_9ASTR|nr:hypothetical protein L1987_65239 [Smallanthus sonchifolius]
MTCLTHQDEDTPLSFSILPAAANISRQNIAPQFTPTANKLEFDSILAWGYDGLSERFWIGRCINTSIDLLAELAINRFYVLTEDNLPWFEWFLEEANMMAYPKHHTESSTTPEQRLAPRFDLIRSSALTKEQVLCWRRFLYNEMVRGLEVQRWSSTGSFGF